MTDRLIGGVRLLLEVASKVRDFIERLPHAYETGVVPGFLKQRPRRACERLQLVHCRINRKVRAGEGGDDTRDRLPGYVSRCPRSLGCGVGDCRGSFGEILTVSAGEVELQRDVEPCLPCQLEGTPVLERLDRLCLPIRTPVHSIGQEGDLAS